MTSQLAFAARRVLLPSAKRLGGGRQAGVKAEVVDQAIGAQAVHVGAIRVGCIFKRRRRESDLRHRERLHFGGDRLSGERERAFERRNLGDRAAALGAGVGVRGLLGQGQRGRGEQSRKGSAGWHFHDYQFSAIFGQRMALPCIGR